MKGTFQFSSQETETPSDCSLTQRDGAVGVTNLLLGPWSCMKAGKESKPRGHEQPPREESVSPIWVPRWRGGFQKPHSSILCTAAPELAQGLQHSPALRNVGAPTPAGPR